MTIFEKTGVEVKHYIIERIKQVDTTDYNEIKALSNLIYSYRYLDFSIGSDAILEEVCQLIHRCIKEQKGSPDIDKAISELLDIF